MVPLDILSCASRTQLNYWTENMNCERRSPSLSHSLPVDGLSAGEIEACAAEGLTFELSREKRNMDMFMKIMMGGWIPQGNRTQWAAFALFVGTLATQVVAWGSGGESLMDLLKMIGEKWQELVAAGGLYFLGEKVDANAGK